MSLTSERLVLAIDSQPQVIGASLMLLKAADLPIKALKRAPYIWFDGSTNALSKPGPTKQDVLEVMFLPKSNAVNGIMDGQIDFGLLAAENNPTALNIVSTQPMSERLRTATNLRGIEGFRDRLAVKLIRASRDLVAEQVQRRKRREEIMRLWENYANWVEARTF